MCRELAIGLLVLLALALHGCSGGSTAQRHANTTAPQQEPAAVTANEPQAPRRWRVFDGELAILEVSDQPGPLTSTALPPPDAKPVLHPFLSASALDAGHEDQLRTLLVSAKSLDEFLRSLEAAGFRVTPQ